MSLIPTEPFRIQVEPRGDATVVQLAGWASMDVSAGLKDTLINLVDVKRKQLILDLSALEFISSVGLGGIIAAHLRCRHCDGSIKLVSPQPAIRELLNVTKLTKLFPIYDSVESAIAAG